MEKVDLNSLFGELKEKKFVYLEKEHLIKVLALATADYLNNTDFNSKLDMLNFINFSVDYCSTVVDLIFFDDIDNKEEKERITKLRKTLNGGNENENN